MAELCEKVREAAVAIEAFPMPGVRVRAAPVKYYAIADGNPDHGFVDITVRLRGGRAPEVKQAAIQEIFNVAKEYLAPVMATNSIALSAEMRDIDPDFSPKTGTIRNHLKEES